jgi:DMSO reductase family type II enzyme heme b subunit
MSVITAKDDPVHIYHWRLQYQVDKEKGVRDIKSIYPNMNIDMYPMDFPDMGTVEKVDESKREVYSYGRAAGNPQSYVKRGVDEIIAEGFGTSAVMERVDAEADGHWAKGEWNVVIARPLHSQEASTLDVGKTTQVAFAIWQGGKDEVGSRKSLTLMWTPLVIKGPNP